MDYVVLDLEWNQSSNGKAQLNKEVPCEIVEIGAVKLNADFEITDQFSELVSPSIYKEMHYITKELIHLDMEQLSKGRPFPEVIKEFFDWCGEDYMFCTWGMMDLTELQRNMKYYDTKRSIGYPVKYFDVQKLFSIAYEDRKIRRSLEFAIDYLNLEKEEQFHRAGSDAYYTALIFQKLDKKVLTNYSIDYYHNPKNRKEEIYAVFDTYSKFISREFESREEALKDKEVSSTRCYVCGRPARKLIRWFSTNNKIYYCQAVCVKHGYLKGKIRMKRAEDGKLFAVKTLKLVKKDEAGKIKERQEQMRIKRRLHKKLKQKRSE